jgi:hypothetical protein
MHFARTRVVFDQENSELGNFGESMDCRAKEWRYLGWGVAA